MFFDKAEIGDLKNPNNVLRATGNTPSVLRAYQNKAPIFGVEFPAEGLPTRLPNPVLFDKNPSFLAGGKTAVGIAVDGRQTGLLLNSYREFATNPFALPKGSVIFRFDDGTYVPIRKF